MSIPPEIIPMVMSRVQAGRGSTLDVVCSSEVQRAIARISQEKAAAAFKEYIDHLSSVQSEVAPT